MSTQSIEWLNNNVLVDETRHGKAWHWDQVKQGDEPNHYQGPIPVEDVQRRLFPWEPIGAPLSIVHKGETITLDDYKAWIRDDTGEVMGIHGDGYVGHSYKRWLLDQVGAILDDNLSIASAGLLDEGAKAWVEVSVPETMTSSEGGVEYLPLLLATTSLDGTIATTYKMTVVLVVCDNTRAAALNGRGNQFKVKHTRNSEMKLTSAQDALGLVMATADEFDKQYSELVLQKVTPKQWAKYLDTQVPMPEEDYAKRDDGSVVVLNKRAITMAERKRDNLVYLYNHDEKVAPWKGTAFGALQAFNTYEHHEARANKGTVRLERNMLRTIKGEYDSLDRDNYKVLQEVLS